MNVWTEKVIERPKEEALMIKEDAVGIVVSYCDVVRVGDLVGDVCESEFALGEVGLGAGGETVSWETRIVAPFILFFFI